MGYEVDFLAVGDGERGGDAIAVRWGNLKGERSEQKVIIIDGGTKDSGKELVKHINKYYVTNKVDYVFCSHPDADHSSGLTEVLENMEVGTLVMHRPWEHASEIQELFKSGKITGTSLEGTLQKSLENAFELEEIAKRKNINLFEPFSNDFIDKNAEIIVLSPSQDFYNVLLANFRETPQPKDSVNLLKSLSSAIESGIKEAINWVTELWHIETLSDPEDNETSAENNSSTILLLQISGRKLLFTGDAGVSAFKEAINKASSLGIELKEAKFIQVPHHGSKHNVGPSILDLIIGPKLIDKIETKTAFVSAPKEGDPKHPSRKVVNAFIRRGVKVVATKGRHVYHFNDSPDRSWGPISPLPFYDQVAD